jgi:hypothetical protein
MATVVIPSAPGSVILTFEYNDEVYGEPGKVWVILHDNGPLGWRVDDTGATPPTPVIIGSMPTQSPNTDPILSPLWGQVLPNGQALVPDTIRGTAEEIFSWIATNNGAKRKVYAAFAASSLAVAWNQWAESNPLALKEPPNVAPPEQPGEALAVSIHDIASPVNSGSVPVSGTCSAGQPVSCSEDGTGGWQNMTVSGSDWSGSIVVSPDGPHSVVARLTNHPEVTAASNTFMATVEAAAEMAPLLPARHGRNTGHRPASEA